MTALPQATGSLNAFGYRGADGAPTTFGQMLEETYTDAMFVWKDGQCLHESYHNGMSPQTVHLLQSVSKSITATAAACLFAEQMMDPAAPITEYLPELEKTAWNGASVQHVLDLTSGVTFNETYEARDSDVGKMDEVSFRIQSSDRFRFHVPSPKSYVPIADWELNMFHSVI